jgi:hypothetical protein
VSEYAVPSLRIPTAPAFAPRRPAGIVAAQGGTMKLYMHPVSMTSRPVRLFIAENLKDVPFIAV